jgi:heme/copper-type cytochrome/quinol oxidase subunit 2
VPTVLKYESLNHLEPSGPVQAFNRDYFLMMTLMMMMIIIIIIIMCCNNNLKRNYRVIFDPNSPKPPGDPE